MKTLLSLALTAMLATGLLAGDKQPTATVTIYTDSGKQYWAECEVKRAEPRFIVFVSRKGLYELSRYSGKPTYRDEGKEITHSGDYTITPD